MSFPKCATPNDSPWTRRQDQASCCSRRAGPLAVLLVATHCVLSAVEGRGILGLVSQGWEPSRPRLLPRQATLDGDIDLLKSYVRDNFAEPDTEPLQGLEVQEQLLRATSAVKVVRLLQATDFETLSPDDVAVACRRLVLKKATMPDSKHFNTNLQSLTQSMSHIIEDHSLSPQNVASLLWAMGATRYSIPEFGVLLGPVSRAVPLVAPEMNPKNLSISLTSLAKLNGASPLVLTAVPPLLNSIIDSAHAMEPPQISAILWAAGELPLTEEQFEPLTSAILGALTLESLRDFTIPELVRMVWGLANLGERDAALLAAIVDIFREALPGMDLKEVDLNVPMFVCGLQRLLYNDEALLQEVARKLLWRKQLIRMPDWGLCALAWSWPHPNDERCKGDVRVIWGVMEARLEKRKLSMADVERSILGPAAFGGD